MSVAVTIKGIPYFIPTPGENSWGETTTNLLIAMVDSLNSASSAGDLADNVNVVIQNNQAAPSNVTGLAFDSSVTKSATIDYYIYRTKGGSEYAETGTLWLVYKDIAGVWDFSRGGSAELAGVDFTVTSGGQFQYTSSNLVEVGAYSGVMRYRARAILP